MLPASAISALGLASQGEGVTIVISHDCDITQDPEFEPFVEIISGEFVDKVNGNYSHGKSPRKLHLEVSVDGAGKIVELNAAKKSLIPKTGVIGLENFDPEPLNSISIASRTTLQHWLASRYRRTAFPDEFEKRLTNAKDFREKFSKIINKSTNSILVIFFDVDEGVQVERQGENDLYLLSILVIYRTTGDPDIAEADAKQACARIRALFLSCFSDGKATWKWVKLTDCETFSEEALTYSQSRILLKWNVDYISLKADPQQDVLD